MAVAQEELESAQVAERARLRIVTESGALAVDAGAHDLGSPTEPVAAEAYHLSPERMNELEADLFEEIRSQVEGNPIAVAVVPHDSVYADFARTSETETYKGYDNHAAMAPYENQSFFLLTFDTNTGTVAHVKRVVRAKTEEELAGSPLTGLEIIDDRIQATGEEHAEAADITAYHGIEDTTTVWNVAANHIMKRQGGKTGLPYTDASYLALFRLTREANVGTILAYVNDDARKSFRDANLQWDLLGGQQYHLPEDPTDPAETHYDTEYEAVCIQDSQHNLDVFAAIPLFVPETDAPIVTAQR
jgi:hypothetical protein